VPRHVVTHSLSHRRETLDLLISHVVSVVKAHRESHQLLAFFSTVTVEAISMMCDAARSATTTGITEESVLQKILPLLEETYRASKIPEFQVGGYMVTTVVVSKIPMNDKVLLALMNGIVSGWSSESISPGLACLALIAQARTGESPGQLPDNVTKKMLALNDIVGRLEQMGDKYRVDNLVVGFAHGILENVGKPYGSREVVYVIRLLERLKLGSKSRKSMLSGLLNLAQNLQGFGEDLEEEGIVRDLLATSLLRWSEQGSTKVGKLLELVFEENKVDVEMLELALRTIIRRPEIQEATAENQEEIETPPQPSTDSMGLEALLANLPESSATVSFLAPEVPALFEQLQQLFLVAMRRSNGVEQLLACSIFVNSKSEAFTISFLARIWTSASNPIVARAAALNQVAKIIKVNAKDGVDYQALIPLSIVSLMDPADQVRRQAAELITRLTKNYKQSEEPEAGSESGKKRKRRGGADSLTYWGLETLYGSGIETSQLKVLDASDAQKFLTIVMGGGLQECVLDPTYVAKVLESGLGSSRDKQKEGRLRSNTKTNILSFLSSHAVNVPSVSIKLRLLSILNQISKAHVSRTQFLLPALQQWVQGSFEQHRKACEQERIHIHHLEEQLVNVVGEGEKADAVITLTAILDKNLGGKGLISTSAKHIINIYNSLDNSLKVSTAKDLLEIRLRDNSEREDLGSSEAIGILRKVRLPTEAFQAWLDNARAALRSALGLDARAQAKRRRTSLTRDSPLCKDDRVVNAILRITVVTELLENQKPQNHSSTLSKLFGVLGDLGSVEYSGITYLQSVLLSCAREIISGYKVTNSGCTIYELRMCGLLID
jgi:U3 small nucleolar RNA-associated protein 10